jgi:signal peptidase II
VPDPDDAPSPAKPPGPASRLGIAIIAGTLIIDQLTKLIADAALEQETLIHILPILGLYLTYNPGIAFSFLTGSNTTLLLGLVIVITIVVLVLWARSSEGGRLSAIGFGLIVGGAIGNIVDRIVQGHVVDFLLLHLGDRDLFIFNLADFALTVGPILLIYTYLFGPRAAARKKQDDAGSDG